MTRHVEDPETETGPSSLLLGPMIMFYQDLVRDDRDFPFMRDPERIPVFAFYPKDHQDERTPDFETRPTKAYIVGWGLRKNHPTLPQRG